MLKVVLGHRTKFRDVLEAGGTPHIPIEDIIRSKLGIPHKILGNKDRWLAGLLAGSAGWLADWLTHWLDVLTG